MTAHRNNNICVKKFHITYDDDMPLQSGLFTVIKLASKYILQFVFLAVLVYCFH